MSPPIASRHGFLRLSTAESEESNQLTSLQSLIKQPNLLIAEIELLNIWFAYTNHDFAHTSINVEYQAFTDICALSRGRATP